MTHVEVPTDLGAHDLSGAGTVFRNRSFVTLWSAQLLSQLASNMVLAALMATVVSATGSNTANAVLILTFLVPAVVFSAAAGVVVERSDARLIMLGCNLFRAAGVVLFIFVGSNVPLILVINLFIATATAIFAPAELTAIPRIVDRRHLMAANSVFVLTINATFAIGFGFLGPLLLTTAGASVVYVVVAAMFGLAALAIVPLPTCPPERHDALDASEATRALRVVVDQVNEGIAFVRGHRRIAWSLAYLGIAASLIGVMGAIGPGFATDILRLTAEDFFFVMGPAGLGAVMGILFLNGYGKVIPRRLIIDIGLVAMGLTLLALSVVKPFADFMAPVAGPIEEQLPTALSPIVSLIALVVVIAVTAGVEYAFVAIPSQTALQEELPVEVRGRIFGILNTLLSVASFLPVLIAPAAADVLNIVLPGAGIPIVMAVLGVVTLYAGIASWRHNGRAGLHSRQAPPGREIAGADEE
ncbi:MAG TPA: MFS transporter [candidate division Zixibacteria bacterium]|nr:MFS transporter [candidate division Zixibacteria bacterium]